MTVRVLKFLASSALLGLLLWWTDVQQITDQLKSAQLSWLVTAFFTLTALTFLMAKRWVFVAHALHIELPFRRALKEYYIAQFINLVLPGGVVGDVRRAFSIRHESDLVRAAQSIAAERVVGQIPIFALMGLSISLSLLLPGEIKWPALLWLAVAAIIVGFAIIITFAGQDTATARFFHLIVSLMKNTRIIIYGLAITALLIFSFYACARAIGISIPINAIFVLVPLILSSMLIPLSVGGWGWREGAAAALFPIIGVSSSAGIATGIVYGAMMTLAALPAVILLVKSPSSTSTLQPTKLDTK